MSSPLVLYSDALRRHAAGEPVQTSLRFDDGSCRALAVPRWAGVADAVDERVLSGVRGPVLDVGCGPGRHLGFLARRGVFALGVDLSPEAIALARGRGARAHVGSIFDSVPHEGRWHTALLLDGNIGIGGHPQRLLRRLVQLLVPDGAILVELDPPGGVARRMRARIETTTRRSDWFSWAQVPADAIDGHLTGSGLHVALAWSDQGRWFARLATP